MLKQSCIFGYRKYQYKNEIVNRMNIVIYMDYDCGFYMCELYIHIWKFQINIFWNSEWGKTTFAAPVFICCKEMQLIVKS